MENRVLTIDDIYENITQKQTDILLLDIFDTIILRKVHPEYVKRIFSKKIKEFYSIALSSDDIYKMRFDIEALLCKENEKRGFDLEFRFEDMSKKLYESLQYKGYLGHISFENFFKKCYESEISSELITHIIDKDIILLAESIKKRGIDVYCLSDFYLSKSMLQELFINHGINNIFNDIIVSSEYRVTKRSGRLYEAILKDLFHNKQLAMVGDNEHSDYKMARKYNIDAYLLNRNDQKAFYNLHFQKALSKEKFYKQIQTIINENGDNDEVFFREIAFTLYYFIHNLYLELVSKEIKNIFFLSREGEFLKKIFDYFLEINHVTNIQTHYFIVSRKSTFLPSLNKLEDENFETLFRQYRKISIASFLKSLNFTTDNINQISNENIRIDIIEEDLPTSETFSQLIKNNTFQKIYENNRLTQRKNIKKYIESFGIDIEQDGLALVDAGWKGTIQDHLFKIFDKKVHVRGFYIGLVADMMQEKKNYKKGLVFDFKNIDDYYKVFFENLAVFEILLGASHGSADRYKLEDENRVIAVMHQEKAEADIFKNKIAPIQEELFKTFQKLSKEFLLSHISATDMRKEVAKIHARLIFTPTKQEVEFFRKLYHFENFGVFDFSTFDKYTTASKKEYFKHVLKFLVRPRKFFEATFWKALALDDIGLLKVFHIYGIYQKIKIFKSM